MTIRRCISLLAILLITGCNAVEGDWVPACTAFSGDRISLRDGRYTWDRFTDERRIGADGKVVDPFPGYPKTGSYDVDGDTVLLFDEAGGTRARYHVHQRAGKLYLLTADEHGALDRGFPDCPLTLDAGGN